MNSNQFDGNALIPIKVVLLGEMAVGKTSIITQYTKKTFDSYEKPTTSSQISSHVIYIDEIKRNIKFDIWDTAGQEKFRSLTRIFYREAHCCLLVYDITNSKSFNELVKYWVKEVKENVNNKDMSK